VADLLDAVVWALPPESEARSNASAGRPRRTSGLGSWRKAGCLGLAKGAEAIELEGEPPAFGDEDQHIEIALVGRPNVGKSSLLNSLLGERGRSSAKCRGRRATPSTRICSGPSEIVLIDTAGIRRPGKVRTAGSGTVLDAAGDQGR